MIINSKDFVETEENEEGDDFIDDILGFCKKSYRSFKSGLLKPFQIPDEKKWPNSAGDEDFFTAVYRHSRKEYFAIPEDETKFFNDAERIRFLAIVINILYHIIIIRNIII